MLNKNTLSLTDYTIKQLILNNIHIGNNKQYRNNDNINFIFNTKKNIDIINIQKTLETLKIILPTITNIISINGKILTILDTEQKFTKNKISSISQKAHQQFLFFWKPGLLSNYKEFKKQKKYNITENIIYLPNFIIFLNNYYHLELKNEIKSLNIPSVILQNTSDKNINLLYTLPSNKKNLLIFFFYINLITNAINYGHSKKFLSFSLTKYR